MNNYGDRVCLTQPLLAIVHNVRQVETFGTGHLESRHGIRTRSVDCPVIFYDTTTVRVCVQSQPT